MNYIEDYVEVDDLEQLPNHEQKKWEAEQLAAARFQFGAKDAKTNQEEYELLLEDQIDFIQALTMEGTDRKSGDERQLTDVERKRLTIEETRKSLPVFPFKEDLIAAIKEHQVRIK